MTEKSWPWSTAAALGDGAVDLGESASREFLALYFGVQDPTVEGVSVGVLNELTVSGAASPLSVATGSAISYGLYINDAVVNLAVSTPAIGTTGGRVVLQTHWAGTGGASLEARTRLALKMSADGVAAIPALTQTPGTTWEISLATFTITTGGVITLTDTRTFRRSTAMVDTDEILDSAVETAKINDLAVTLAKLAADSVDDSKAGDRVPQFYRRRGGSATDWKVPGTTTYTPGAVRMQAGSELIEMVSGIDGFALSFPVAFSQPPLVFCTAYVTNGITDARVMVLLTSISASAIQGNVFADGLVNSWDTADIALMWLAIGAE